MCIRNGWILTNKKNIGLLIQPDIFLAYEKVEI